MSNEVTDGILANIAKLIKDPDQVRKFSREILQIDDRVIDNCIGTASVYERNYQALHCWSRQNGASYQKLLRIIEEAKLAEVHFREAYTIIKKDGEKGTTTL